MKDSADSCCSGDVVRNDEETVGSWNDPQPISLPEAGERVSLSHVMNRTRRALPVKDVILGLSSLTQCPLTIGSLVRGSGPEAPNDGGPPLLDVRAWGAFSELGAFRSVTTHKVPIYRRTHIVEDLHTSSFPGQVEIGHHTDPLAGVIARRQRFYKTSIFCANGKAVHQ